MAYAEGRLRVESVSSLMQEADAAPLDTANVSIPSHCRRKSQHAPMTAMADVLSSIDGPGWPLHPDTRPYAYYGSSNSSETTLILFAFAQKLSPLPGVNCLPTLQVSGSPSRSTCPRCQVVRDANLDITDQLPRSG
ncbi:hypothetical protein [Paraburkholderia flagellata]|uniref:hypothetical protein n=1 Tax=Paraburkholderia flagellata TaxID=2883241 RepID=UPI001F2AD210|nr:hypothetical protein [Paraburkholderia flagellata]